MRRGTGWSPAFSRRRAAGRQARAAASNAPTVLSPGRPLLSGGPSSAPVYRDRLQSAARSHSPMTFPSSDAGEPCPLRSCPDSDLRRFGKTCPYHPHGVHGSRSPVFQRQSRPVSSRHDRSAPPVPENAPGRRRRRAASRRSRAHRERSVARCQTRGPRFVQDDAAIGKTLPAGAGAAGALLLASSAPAMAADPPLMKLVAILGCFTSAVGSEVGFCLVRGSPVASWTRGGSRTPSGAKGLPAPEHDC
jgi:hypothetical protein